MNSSFSAYFINGRIIRHLFVIVFGLLLIGPTVGYFIFPFQQVDFVENRKLADFPTVTPSSPDFVRQVDSYVNDHFGFRDKLLGLNTLGNQMLTHLRWGNIKGDILIGDVLVGSNGWLFYSGDDGIADLARHSYLSFDQMTTFDEVLKKRISVSEQNHVTYVVATAPDKSTIYPEYLPWGVLNANEESRLDRLEAFLKSDPIVDSHFVSLVPPLMDARKYNLDLYFKTDTHWNERGAYYGYKALMDKFSSITSDKLYLFNCGPNDFLGSNPLNGDLNVMAGLSWRDMDVGFPNLPDPVEVTKFWVPDHDFETLHLKGTNLPFCIYNKRARSPKTLLVFSDSFGEFLMPYFRESFRRVIGCTFQPVLDNRLAAIMISRVHPDVVLDMRVERFLNPDNQRNFTNSLTEPFSINFDLGSLDKLLTTLADGSWQIVDSGNQVVLRQEGVPHDFAATSNSKWANGQVERISLPYENADQFILEGNCSLDGGGQPFDGLVVTLGTQVVAVDQPSLSGFKLTLPSRVFCLPGAVRVFGLKLGGGAGGSNLLEEVKMAIPAMEPIPFYPLKIEVKAGQLNLVQ